MQVRLALSDLLPHTLIHAWIHHIPHYFIWHSSVRDTHRFVLHTVRVYRRSILTGKRPLHSKVLCSSFAHQDNPTLVRYSASSDTIIRLSFTTFRYSTGKPSFLIPSVPEHDDLVGHRPTVQVRMRRTAPAIAITTERLRRHMGLDANGKANQHAHPD